MTTDQNKELVIRFNKEFIEGGNMNTLNELLAPDFINHTAPPGVSKGPDGVAYFFNNILKAAFPDLTVEILDQIAEGNKVATRKCFHATHKGDFFGVPASIKKVTIDVMDIIYLRDGIAVEL
ncbi:MAG: ester cyclase, partial [Flavisolibacter sp.]|nr:ester cyclase [Flavisolibacter sp.]